MIIAYIMPDLGAYATEVGLAYGVSLLLLALLIGQSLWKGRKIKERLRKEEEARKGE
jgi:heme exporter protein D